ncbi:MAG TPA: isoprenylcysteine carboxylmethyltransferase family protein [Candidatus Sulfotelmatobacter sp.]|nr:isoprenylcysteine carboxylmethyltransferase family protein [Candidatus Sulfotelmatobacter sp.]
MSVALLWRILYWLWVASEVIIGVATRTKHSTGQTRDRGSLILLWVVIFSSMTAGIWYSEIHPHNLFGSSPAVRPVALAILILGLAVRWTAIYTLGKSFSSNVAILDSQKLNRSGLYRFVRHPSYLGLLLIFLAVALHTRNWLSLTIILIPCTAVLLYRIHVEEAALRRAFGADYADYTKSTSRLLPGLY